MSFKNIEGKIARLIQRLQAYNFTSENRQGRKHKHTDSVSRRPFWELCTHCFIVEEQADVKQARAIVAVAAADWYLAALRI
jgi:hypothetical protein